MRFILLTLILVLEHLTASAQDFTIGGQAGRTVYMSVSNPLVVDTVRGRTINNISGPGFITAKRTSGRAEGLTSDLRGCPTHSTYTSTPRAS